MDVQFKGPSTMRHVAKEGNKPAREVLERVTDESDRQQVINLLAEERQKQKDAGDPVW